MLNTVTKVCFCFEFSYDSSDYFACRGSYCWALVIEILKKQLFLKNNCVFYGCKEKKQYFCK